MSAARGPPDIEPGINYVEGDDLTTLSPAVGTTTVHCKPNAYWAGCRPFEMSFNSALLHVPNAGAGVENVETAWTGKARADTDKGANELHTRSPALPASFVSPLLCQELPNKLSFSLTTESVSLSTRLQTAWFAHSQLPLLRSMRSRSVLV
jgi:hypothetical protein